MPTLTCLLCGEAYTGGVQLMANKAKEHAQKAHPKEHAEYEKQAALYSEYVKAAEQKGRELYPLVIEGVLRNFRNDDGMPAKKWKCPRCGKEVSYHNKYWHMSNPGTACLESKLPPEQRKNLYLKHIDWSRKKT